MWSLLFGRDVGLIKVVGPNGVEGGHVPAMPDMKEASSAVSARPSSRADNIS